MEVDLHWGFEIQVSFVCLACVRVNGSCCCAALTRQAGVLVLGTVQGQRQGVLPPSSPGCGWRCC